MATATFTKREERENESNAASKAAYEVTRKYAVRLCSCFAVRDLVIRLYADSLIDQVTFEKWANPSSSPTESATMILLDVQRSVSLQNDGISKLCSILSESDEDTAEVAKDIEEAYVLEFKKQVNAMKAHDETIEKKELEKLRKQLESCKLLSSQIDDPPVESIDNLVQKSIQNYIKVLIRANVDIQDLKKSLKELCENEVLISSQKFVWAIQEVDKIINRMKVSPSNSSAPFIMVKPLNDKFIGDGSFARVQIVVYNEERCAAKRYLRSRCKEFSSEFTLLAQLQHENIVRYIGLAAPLGPDEHPAIVMKLMDTDLHNRIISNELMTINQKLKILHDVAKGLDYLHSYKQKIIHRDLTARNVLLDSTGLAKISDFGNSRMVNNEQLTTMTSNVGTDVYRAPEALGDSYCEKIDIFSFGHLMLFILIREFPCKLTPVSYYDKDPGNGIHVPKVCLEVERRQKYLETLEKQTDSETSHIELIRKCLSNQPEERPTASQLIDFTAAGSRGSQAGQ